MENDLRARVKAALPGKTVEWDVRPERSAYPACIMETVTGSRDQHMQGFTGFQPTQVQFNCFATTKRAASEMRETVIAAIAPEATQGTTEFLRAQDILVRQRPQNTTTGFTFCEIVEMTIWHN